MKKTDQSLEVEFLLSLALIENEYPIDQLIDFLKDINWGSLIEISIQHKMLPTVGYHLYHHHEKLKKNRYVKFHLGNFFIRNYNINRLKKQTALRLSKGIVDRFEQEEMQIVMNKGLTLENFIHRGDCRRHLGSDIDFMIKPEDRLRAQDILLDMGFKMGTYNVGKRAIEEHSRQNMLIYRLSPDHLPRFTTKTNELICEYVDIDFANSFTWHNSNFHIPLADAFMEIEKVDIDFEGEKYVVPKLGLYYEFIFVILHLYREAWFYKRDITIGQDVNIKKFFDVIQYIKKYEDIIFSDNFMSFLDRYDVAKPFKWVILHTDNVFNTKYSENMNTQDINDEYLNSACESTGNLKRWEGNMRDRLFSNDRESLFV